MPYASDNGPLLVLQLSDRGPRSIIPPLQAYLDIEANDAKRSAVAHAPVQEPGLTLIFSSHIMKPGSLNAKLIPTIYEDDYLLVVDKPAGFDVGGASGPSGQGVVEMLARQRGDGALLLPANRLARFESGILLLGKNPSIVEHIRTGMRTNRIEQEFVAVVIGKMSQPRLTIESGSKRKPERKAADRRSSRPKRTPSRPASNEPKATLQRIRQGAKFTQVRIRTTARNTHALRAQLRSVNLRLLGDSLHDSSARAKRPERTALHLARFSFHHPAQKKKLSLTSRPPEVFNSLADGSFGIERALHAALARRIEFMDRSGIDAYRLLTGSVEDVRGLVAERWGTVVILQILEDLPKLDEALPSVAKWYRDMLGVQAVYAKRFVKDRSRATEAIGSALRSEKPLLGRAVSESIVIQEHDLKFIIRPYDGFSVGLFLDHRENRRRVMGMSDSRCVLNLFAYTCGFSLAAAVGGATETVSVDLSQKYLDWGKDNFKKNGVNPDSHRFVCADAQSFLARATRADEQFDLIIIDPPSFAHGRKRGKDFSVSRDLADLIRSALGVLAPDGVMMVSTSYRRMSRSGLRDRLKRGAGARKYRVMETPALPADFAADPDHAKTVFARFT